MSDFVRLFGGSVSGLFFFCFPKRLPGVSAIRLILEKMEYDV